MLAAIDSARADGLRVVLVTGRLLPGTYFRTEHGPTGFVALNLRRFTDHLRHCDPAELRHHAAGHDLARWIRDVHRDEPLADRLIRLEDRIAAGTDPDSERAAIVGIIEHRYGLDLDTARGFQ